MEVFLSTRHLLRNIPVIMILWSISAMTINRHHSNLNAGGLLNWLSATSL